MGMGILDGAERETGRSLYAVLLNSFFRHRLYGYRIYEALIRGARVELDQVFP